MKLLKPLKLCIVLLVVSILWGLIALVDLIFKDAIIIDEVKIKI